MLIKSKEIIIQSWNLYTKNFKLLMQVIIWLFIPAVLLSILPILKVNYLVIPLSLLLTFISFVLGLWLSVALIIALGLILKKEKVNLKTIYQEAYSKIISYLWVSILVGLVVFFGFLLLIVPGIIFAVWFSMAIFVLIFESVRGIEALKKSKEMVKNYFWAVLWRWVAPYFFFGIIVLAVICIPLYLLGLALGSPLAGFTETPPWWANLISNIVSIVAMPIFSAIGVLLYNSLKKEKETTVK